MAIDVEAIETMATVTTESTIRPTKLWLERLSIDASARDFAKIAVEVVLAPYTDTGVFASSAITHRTANAAGAAQWVPEMGIAIEAIQEAIAAMHREIVRRKATETKMIAEAEQAKADEDKAAAARNAAFPARTGVDDPQWMAVDAAWEKACAVASAAVKRSEAATLSAADVCNPPVASN